MAASPKDGPQRPLIIELDETALPDVPPPAEAPPPAEPDASPGEEGGASAGARMIAAAGTRHGFSLGRALLWVLSALLLLWLGVAMSDFVSELLASRGWLGWLALGLVSLLGLLLVALVVREAAALARLSGIETLRERAAEAMETGSASQGRATIDALLRLYRGREELEWARGRLHAAEQDTPDIAGRLEIAERELIAPLDRAAEVIVRRAARDVATATALIPLAFIDVIAALAVNLRMIREIAETYGGRAGWLGSWRLLRIVAAHLIATGAVAVADDLIGPMVGGGVLARLSRRFGEGALNGALTARVGVATIEVCRPLPFIARQRPSASGILLSALKGWRREAGERKATGR